jgi:hypothetical protein
MSEIDKQRSDPNLKGDAARGAARRHDIDDLNVWAVIKFAIGILILGIVAYIALYGMLKLFEHRRLASQRPAPAMARGAEERLPPPPRLQMMPGSPSEFKTPDYDMRVMREEEEKRLTTYGWVNKEAGIARIPIDEAMKRVLEKGLPTKQPPATPAATQSAGPAAPAPREER